MHRCGHMNALIDNKQLMQLVPVSRRTLCVWREKGIIPYIKVQRRLLYDWKKVEEAIMRHRVNYADDAHVSDA